ncbi:MAG: hypothetical protein ACTHOH_03925 [Lysobacteraceae bacterium]
MRFSAIALLLGAIAGCGESGSSFVPSSGHDIRDQYQHQIPAFGGRLLGSNHGEWGGWLSFQYDDGTVVRLLETNVVGLRRMPFGVVVVTGFWHLTADDGKLLLVTRNGDRKLRVEVLAVLPHAAVKSWQRKDGSLDIAMLDKDIEPRDGVWAFRCVHLRLYRRVESTPCPRTNSELMRDLMDR